MASGSGSLKLHAPKGLGDAVYLRAVARHLVLRGHRVEVATPWPGIFDDLPVFVRRHSEGSGEFRHVAMCSCRIAHVQAMDHFTNACRRAGIDEQVDLEIGWRVRNTALVERVKRRAGDRPILIYQPIKIARNDDQRALRPSPDALYGEIDPEMFRVKLGHPSFVNDCPEAPCDLSLFGETSATDLFDLATVADRIVSEVCYLIPLAQALRKPLTAVFSKKAMESPNIRISMLNPRRLLHRPELARVVIA